MNELELIKTILRKLAQMEAEMLKMKDLDGIMEQLITHEEQVDGIHDTLDELKLSVELKHMENINSDEFLIRSLRHP